MFLLPVCLFYFALNTASAYGACKDYFTCGSGECVHPYWACDGIIHCKDGSDEDRYFCETRKCNKFRCNNGQCIHRSLMCDIHEHCTDKSDEDPKMCNPFDCRSQWFTCDNNKCLHPYSPCDGIDDCGDGSDENPEFCETRTCPSDFFQCRSGQCIDRGLICNSEDNCADGSDEDAEICQFADCGNRFQCKSGHCLDSYRQCDLRLDCKDGSDEDYYQCEALFCTGLQFYCRNTTICIEPYQTCDGIKDCPDGSDEDVNHCGENTTGAETVSPTLSSPSSENEEDSTITFPSGTTESPTTLSYDGGSITTNETKPVDATMTPSLMDMIESDHFPNERVLDERLLATTDMPNQLDGYDTPLIPIPDVISPEEQNLDNIKLGEYNASASENLVCIDLKRLLQNAENYEQFFLISEYHQKSKQQNEITFATISQFLFGGLRDCLQKVKINEEIPYSTKSTSVISCLNVMLEIIRKIHASQKRARESLS